MRRLALADGDLSPIVLPRLRGPDRRPRRIDDERVRPPVPRRPGAEDVRAAGPRPAPADAGGTVLASAVAYPRNGGGHRPRHGPRRLICRVTADAGQYLGRPGPAGSRL